MPLEAALNLAREKGLDLIEVSAAANPPVARIISFDKFRYLEMKKLKKERAKQGGQELKQVQLGIGTAKNDLELKARKVEEFLNEKHPVVIVLVLRGREKANKDFARGKLEEFMKFIQVEYQMTMQPRWGMRGLTTQIAKR